MDSDLNQMLVLRDSAKNQLLQIKTVDEGVDYLNKLSAIETWVKAEKKDAELQNIVAEQKIRTQRVLGVLLKSSEKNTGAMGIGNSVVTTGNHTPKLSEIGISKKQSSTFQQIAEIPDDDFEEFIEEKKQAVKNAVSELTTTGAVRLAKSLKEKKEDVMLNNKLQERMDEEKELRSLAKEVNLKYTKEQRQLFVSLIKI